MTNALGSQHISLTYVYHISHPQLLPNPLLVNDPPASTQITPPSIVLVRDNLIEEPSINKHINS